MEILSFAILLFSFVDEPISPSVDQEAALIPPSAVISVAQSATTGTSSPGSQCPPIRRQLSHDQGEEFFLHQKTCLIRFDL